MTSTAIGRDILILNLGRFACVIPELRRRRTLSAASTLKNN